MKRDQIILLIKYIDPMYLWSFLEGDVHFASLNYFREEEIRNQDKVLGDRAEGAIFDYGNVSEVAKLGQDIQALSSEQVKILMDNVSLEQKIPFEIGISPEDRNKIGIASFFAITYDDVMKDPNRNRVHGVDMYCIKSNVIKDMEDFNRGYDRIPVVIPFKDILLGTFTKQQIDFDKIGYYDSQKYQSKIVNEVKEKSIRAVFYKRKEYAGQREFRLITEISDSEKGDTVRVPIVTNLTKMYGKEILPQLVFGWKEDPEVTTRLSQCEKTLLFGNSKTCIKLVGHIPPG